MIILGFLMPFLVEIDINYRATKYWKNYSEHSQLALMGSNPAIVLQHELKQALNLSGPQFLHL